MISQLLKTWRETAFNRMQNLGFGLKSSHSANLNILLISFVIQNYYQAVVLSARSPGARSGFGVLITLVTICNSITILYLFKG